MAGNSFGSLFRVTTAGESHGPGNVVIVDGVPAGLELSVDDLAVDLARRRPGQSSITSPRRESDEAEILAAYFSALDAGRDPDLLELCGGRAELAERLDELLHRAPAVDALLGSLLDDGPEEPETPARLGEFEILEEVVYVDLQTEAGLLPFRLRWDGDLGRWILYRMSFSDVKDWKRG